MVQKGEIMNRRTVKRVKDPKACRPCGHCILDYIGSQPMYRCKVKPIMAQRENSCEKFYPLPTQAQQERSKDKEAPEFADADREDKINNVVGPVFCRAYNYLNDLKNLNDRLSADSAVRLLYSALSDLKSIAGLMNINVEED